MMASATKLKEAVRVWVRSEARKSVNGFDGQMDGEWGNGADVTGWQGLSAPGKSAATKKNSRKPEK